MAVDGFTETWETADTTSGIDADQQWTINNGDWRISNNRAKAGSHGTRHEAHCHSELSGDDVEVDLAVHDYPPSQSGCGPMLRLLEVNGTRTYWYVEPHRVEGQLVLDKVIDGSGTRVVEDSWPTELTQFTVRGRAVGNDVSGEIVEQSLIWSYEDTAGDIATGRFVGIRTFGEHEPELESLSAQVEGVDDPANLTVSVSGDTAQLDWDASPMLT